jgi:hypothetical protein
MNQAPQNSHLLSDTAPTRQLPPRNPFAPSSSGRVATSKVNVSPRLTYFILRLSISIPAAIALAYLRSH